MKRRRWRLFPPSCLIVALFPVIVVWSTAATAATLSLGWADASNNELGFKVERRLSGGTFAQIATPGANTTSYTDTGLADGTTYCYQVRATAIALQLLENPRSCSR